MVIDLMGFYPDEPELSGMGPDILIPLLHRPTRYRGLRDNIRLGYKEENSLSYASTNCTTIGEDSNDDKELVDEFKTAPPRVVLSPSYCICHEWLSDSFSLCFERKRRRKASYKAVELCNPCTLDE
ncbi:hypothetical protein ACLOJK_041399 [Asimina triloba]